MIIFDIVGIVVISLLLVCSTVFTVASIDEICDRVDAVIWAIIAGLLTTGWVWFIHALGG